MSRYRRWNARKNPKAHRSSMTLPHLQRDANRLLGFTAQQTLGLCPKPLRKEAYHLPPHGQPLIDGGYGGIPSGAGDGHWAGRLPVEEPMSHPCAAGHQRQQSHRPPCACCPRKVWLQRRSCRPPCRGAECPAADCRTDCCCAVGEAATAMLETTADHRSAPGRNSTAKGKVVLSEGWKAVERKILARAAGQAEQELGCSARCSRRRASAALLGAELKEGQTSPPKHFTEDTLLSRYGNRQCGQYAGGRGASGHRHPGNESRHHRKAGAEGLSGTQGQQENQGAAAHRTRAKPSLP